MKKAIEQPFFQKKKLILHPEMDLHYLISQGEHQQQDFKYMISSVPKIARSVSAFANTDGGRLLVGVRDNGKIAGVKSDEEIYMIDAAATTQCIPSVDCLMETVQEEGHTVLIATIPPCDERPVRAKDEDGQLRAYVRIDDENIQASPIHLEMWRQERSPIGDLQTFTDREVRWLGMLDGDGLTLNRFCRQSRLERHKAIRLLARWIRFEIIELHHDGKQWIVSAR